MKSFSPKKRTGPEAEIQEAIINLLKTKDWFAKETHGNAYQFGFPDVYAAHRLYGARWIETKNPVSYSFTPAQLDTFPMMSAKGVGIWILTAATEEQYQLLFGAPNWQYFLPAFSLLRPT